jgi:hypothetical protein
MGTMIHIHDETTKMLAKWRKEGFNGVRFFECYVEKVNSLEDFLSDGLTKEDHEKFIKDYVVFVAHPQEPLDFDIDNEYTRVRFNKRKFIRDLMKEMTRILGDDIDIVHHEGCQEFEISRKKIGV